MIMITTVQLIEGCGTGITGATLECARSANILLVLYLARARPERATPVHTVITFSSEC
jgi:hypothetical protein